LGAAMTELFARHNIKPLDDFFATLMRAHNFRMTRKAAEASRQTVAEEAHCYERRNAECPNTHNE
jgi:hypothetical protein